MVDREQLGRIAFDAMNEYARSLGSTVIPTTSQEQGRAMGRRIRELRQGMGWSQEELEKRSGVPQETISRIELGKIAKPTHDDLSRIVRALGVPMEQISGEVTSPCAAEVVPTWETETERSREGLRCIAVAVARAVQTANAPIRYRRVSLNGHLSLGVCRVVEVSVGGATMLSATTLCDEKERTVEFPASSVYRLDVLTETEALDAAREASERRAAQARAEEERTRREAREQAVRREARANVTAAVTVFGPHVEVIVTDAYGDPRGDLLRRDDAEVIEALRAAEIEPYTASILCTKSGLVSRGLEITHEVAKVDAIVAMLHGLGFGTIERRPDQPARVEVPDEEIPFDPAPVGGDMT